MASSRRVCGLPRPVMRQSAASFALAGTVLLQAVQGAQAFSAPIPSRAATADRISPLLSSRVTPDANSLNARHMLQTQVLAMINFLS